MNKIIYKTSDNLSLVGVWHLPKIKTKDVIILTHGITVDKDEDGVFVKLANKLSSKGFAVLRFDFRGHGESEGKQIDFTIAGQLNDLDATLNEVKKHEFEHIHLLGASFGGGASAIFSTKNQGTIHSLCLWNPVLNYEHTFVNPTLPWIRERKAHMRNDIDSKGWTTLGSRKFILGKTIFEEMSKLKPFIKLKRLEIPTLIVHGTKDTKVPYEDSEMYVKYLENGKLYSIANAEHGFHEKWEYDIAEKVTVDFFRLHR